MLHAKDPLCFSALSLLAVRPSLDVSLEISLARVSLLALRPSLAVSLEISLVRVWLWGGLAMISEVVMAKESIPPGSGGCSAGGPLSQCPLTATAITTATLYYIGVKLLCYWLPYCA